MKALNATATKIFANLVKDLKEPGEDKKFDSGGPALMPVCVDFLQDFGNGLETYAVAHRFEMNGDLVPDPDVEFLVRRSKDRTVLAVWPLAIDMAPPFAYRRHVELGADGKPERLNQAGQYDLASFCSRWMRNIKHQQSI